MLPTPRVPAQPQDLLWCDPGTPLWSTGMRSECPFQAGPPHGPDPCCGPQTAQPETFQREHSTDSHNPNSQEMDLDSYANGLSFIVEHALPVMRKAVHDPHLLPGEQSGGRGINLESGNRALSFQRTFTQTFMMLISTHAHAAAPLQGDRDGRG